MANASPVIRVLFVCTGNICRSPTAEGVFRHLAGAAGLAARFEVGSAGTDSYHVGEAPDKRAVKIARAHGVQIGHQRARALVANDYEIYDHIYAMDGGHYHELKERAPATHRARIEMFLSACPHHEKQDVPDPWYGDEKGFQDVYALVDEGSAALLKKLCEEHKL